MEPHELAVILSIFTVLLISGAFYLLYMTASGNAPSSIWIAIIVGIVFIFMCFAAIKKATI